MLSNIGVTGKSPAFKALKIETSDPRHDLTAFIAAVNAY